MSKILKISNFKKNKITLKDSKEKFIDDINKQTQTEHNNEGKVKSPKKKFELTLHNKKILNSIPKDERFTYLSNCKEMDKLKEELVDFQDMTKSELREKLNRYHKLFIYLQQVHQRYVNECN